MLKPSVENAMNKLAVDINVEASPTSSAVKSLALITQKRNPKTASIPEFNIRNKELTYNCSLLKRLTALCIFFFI